MKTQDTSTLWGAFQALNGRRRAIRDFDGIAIPDEHVRELLAEAARAPSSGNLQPYRFHWIRDTTLKARVAAVCNGQRAAVSASTLIVVTASRQIALSTAAQQLAYLNASTDLPEASKAYHRKQLQMFLRILNVGSWPVWTPLTALAGLFRPSLSLLPVGHLATGPGRLATPPLPRRHSCWPLRPKGSIPARWRASRLRSWSRSCLCRGGP